MAFDGIVTRAVVNQLSQLLTGAKIEKVYQPEQDQLIFLMHSKEGKKKLFLSSSSSHARIHLTEESFENPVQPPAFCMLLRKHLGGGRIKSISQKDTERIVEIDIQTTNELGFSTNKKLIIEIMGKHSNIILIDVESGKIIDCIKHISIDVNRIRQLLPGKMYEYPPSQGKTCLFNVEPPLLDDCLSLPLDLSKKELMNKVEGLSPNLAESICLIGKKVGNIYQTLADISYSISDNTKKADTNSKSDYISCSTNFDEVNLLGDGTSCFVYLDDAGKPCEFHVFKLINFQEACNVQEFDSVSNGIEFYYKNKSESNRVKQKSSDLERAVKAVLDKLYLKKQRLLEDIVKAEAGERYRLYGELINANLYMIDGKSSSVNLISYYDGSEVAVPLDVRYSPAKNAQIYFKKYGKAKTALKEKALQLEETDIDISYLESVDAFIENAGSVEETELLRAELIENGFLRKRKNSFTLKKGKTKPMEFKILGKYRVLVGKTNIENDLLTFKMTSNKDLWFHTKDIPGSHVVLFTEGLSLDELEPEAIYQTASLAAYFSKGRNSENVPVDYVPIKYVKKPAGAKPGMVIFTNNRTVWVNPKLPD